MGSNISIFQRAIYELGMWILCVLSNAFVVAIARSNTKSQMLPTKLHGEHCAQAYDCFPFELLCEFALLVLTCATPD